MQQEFVLLLKGFMMDLHRNINDITRYEWGTERVQSHEIKPRLNRFIKDYGLEVGNTVTHAHGIGNNCMYPVYYTACGEIQHCANININSGLYGECYVSVEDYNGKVIGSRYEIRARCGVTIKR
jgi:hypothetical protein